ncbi:coiled-coil domain-containing protein 33 isoform X1 [Silurus meridionalis]|uniref:coiled-coil domain-containing protein 33 isoform X1 n=1 Tax=Silurus meridionalis TaxID=175797 RepID=UPI001EE9FC45|nr:coiled-coil domain-containing protein 33 isoform X1 [Silurus meridionalis]XP_046715086.1 coiled-coil domain-containing protein 33 isoform X1 [Silurus meridionalis]XP_046715087.1 coiled-coil domain-containing protein 33 isoform X1 [Silurus meridionalis]XP_046715088.1 coiled-coil domain-containing protein 33 isoform X1 [Silurus meridionalis]XP_046715089.1 coiled-coil domain-containing protein 33 isoform X1 [Silurus meridionalis]XP_046715090.1 coiled-coil domain-containing protein 33 isoform X
MVHQKSFWPISGYLHLLLNLLNTTTWSWYRLTVNRQRILYIVKTLLRLAVTYWYRRWLLLAGVHFKSKAHRAVPSGVHVYVTMVRKLSLLPRLPCFFFSGFELQRDGFDLPAYDALAQILPEYQHIFKTPKAPKLSNREPREQKKSKRSLELNQTFEIPSPHERLQLPTVQDDDPHAAQITEHQTKEMENYRSAMCKMAEDILALRSQVASLEEQNSQLRSELSMNQDLGRTLLDDTDIDVMTKAEIADRIVTLKCKLASESSKAADQRDKIQQLQNELIRKNDNEKELMRLQRVHKQQEAVLLRYQGQIKKFSNLEATVRQQEKVIERMEKVLTTKLKERNKENAARTKKVLKEKDSEDSRMREIESILAAENTRLRDELERLRQHPQPIIIQQAAQVHLTTPFFRHFITLYRQS